MKKELKFFLLVCFTILLTSKGKSQDFFVLLSDSNFVKKQCYLMISLDQLQAGVSMSNLKFDSVSIQRSKIEPLKSKGLTYDLLFFRFKIINVNNDTLKYIFCYNQELRQFYKVGFFEQNDSYNIFTYLKDKGVKLKKGTFESKKISVEDVDLACLFNFYRSKGESRFRKIINEDRQDYECLRGHYSVVIVP